MPVDVMPKPDDSEAFYAAQQTTFCKFYYYHPKERKEAAREALRRIGKSESYQTEDGMCDVALEELWNIMSGNNECR